MVIFVWLSSTLSDYLSNLSNSSIEFIAVSTAINLANVKPFRRQIVYSYRLKSLYSFEEKPDCKLNNTVNMLQCSYSVAFYWKFQVGIGWNPDSGHDNESHQKSLLKRPHKNLPEHLISWKFHATFPLTRRQNKKLLFSLVELSNSRPEDNWYSYISKRNWLKVNSVLFRLSYQILLTDLFHWSYSVIFFWSLCP